MAPWITLLLGLVACLGFALAAPIEESASDVTPVILRGEGPYPYSLQIQVEEVKPFYYVWDIFQGPSGVAVNPCGDTRFEKVYHGEPGWHTDKPDMDRPPYPQNYAPFVPQFDVKIKYGNRNNCVYHATGTDAGQFRCGNEYIIDCKKDFRCSPYFYPTADLHYHLNDEEIWKLLTMLARLAFLICVSVVLLLGSSFATSIQSLSIELQNNRTARGLQADGLTNSIQIMIERQAVRGYYWILYVGPYDVKANPCPIEPRPFYLATMSEKFLFKRNDINHPPNPPAMELTFVSKRDGREDQCKWKTNGNGDPGQLICGDFMIMDCKRDANWNDGVINCLGFAVHRGWACNW
ncbi:hypothetical protein ACET3X_003529 [Alternaria dauci]|uniref:Uncharacterized protein n=1 Tax=Alternaria dauci TaxID=48095 RepID=A0ABR3USP1_9PLEO